MRQTILIVEDNSDIREITAELLSVLGFDVVQADGGTKALAQLDQHRPDIIICDIVMPGMDGYDFYEMFKSRFPNTNIPFIFATAQSQKADLEKAAALGIKNYLIKPFDDKDLLRCIEKACRETI